MIQQLTVQGTHAQVGRLLGERFATKIHQALDSYDFLQNRLLPYHRTKEGRARYRALLKLHQSSYPAYVAELDGIAQGARRSFEDLFLANMRGEYREHLRSQEKGCSDCALLTDTLALIGHNEDGSPAFRGNLYLVHAEIPGAMPWTALSYPGFLCGNAFGFNAAGICFSVDNVRPNASRIGLGRHFLARSLLEARSLDDAVNRVTVPGRAFGFSYTLGSVSERRIVHVEVAPEEHHVQEISGFYFHANHYQELDGIDQVIDPSSQARVDRVGALARVNPPSSERAVLTLLGDRGDERYPVYRTATPPDRGMTLCTALFDLDARRLKVYTRHPKESPDELIEMVV
jgi:hypothetical protein